MTRATAALMAVSTLVGSVACAAQPRVVSLPVHRTKGPSLIKRNTVSAALNNDLQIALYAIDVFVGTPSQKVTLQLDTGSSDLWMFGPNSCDAKTSACFGGNFNPQGSSTITRSNTPFSIQYVTPGSGVNGTYFLDNVQIGGVTVKNQTMALATSAVHVNTGICGVSFTADESSASNLKETYPNIVDTMVSEGLIATKAYSLYLDDLEQSSGQIIFGGYDSAKYQGDLIGLPIQKDAQSGGYTSMTVAWTSLAITDASGSTGLITTSSFASPAILDSGTSLTLVPQDIYNTVANYFGAQDTGQGVSNVNCDIAQQKGSLDFGFGGAGGPIIAVPFSELAVPAYGLDGKRVTYDDGTPACLFGLTYTVGREPVLFGDTFLRSAYVVYDLSHYVIGLAQTNFDSSSSDVHEIGAGGIGAAATQTAVQVTPTPYHPIEVSQPATPTANTPPPAFVTGKTLPGSPTTEAVLSKVSIPTAAAATSTGGADLLSAKGGAGLGFAAAVGLMGMVAAA